MEDFVLRALAAGLGIVVLTGPLGCFVVWRRMAYFGDALSHAALLGVALGIFLGIDTSWGVVLVSSLVAILLVLLQQRRWLASDTLLGILAHTTLSLGLVFLAFMQTVRVDLLAYLFGDILAVTRGDLYWIYGGGAVVLAILVVVWRPLLAVTVDADLAYVEGRPVLLLRFLFVILVAWVVAAALKIVGILLVTSLLIIPAACARQLAHSPRQMGFLAVIFGWLAVFAGIGSSLTWDTPTGPSIVLAAGVIFAFVSLLPRGHREAR